MHLFFYIFIFFSFGFLNFCKNHSQNSHSPIQNFPQIKDFTADTNLRELFFLCFKAAKPFGDTCLKTVEAIKKFQPIHQMSTLCQKDMLAYFQNGKNPKFLKNIFDRFELFKEKSPLLKDFLIVFNDYRWGGVIKIHLIPKN